MASTSSATTTPLLVVHPPSPTGTPPPPVSRPSSSHSEPGHVLAFRLGNDMAYVGRAEDYQDALGLLRTTWPVLATIPDERISVKIKAGENRVTITPSAWRDLTLTIRAYQTLYVCVAAPPKSTLNDCAPPAYEANAKRSHSRSSSTSSKSGSRGSSKSPKLTTRALEFFGKRS